MERFIENAMYASRWLLAPIYFGLSLGLLALALKFFQEIFHIIPLNWLGKMDSSSLKMKVAASIVAISSIHLLRVFMDAKNIEPQYLMWYVIIHMTFVVSAFAMGYLDKLTKH
ncbi:MAG: hypothetical protein EOP12_01400 [Pseudomonas sp.]|nr:MAG: hypothetical protein EOP12_01400 [Pseudomonas sp.]